MPTNIKPEEIDFEKLKEASKKGQLFWDHMGRCAGHCDMCGKYGWTYIVSVGETQKSLGGHIQNGYPCYGLGPACFEKIKAAVNGKWERFTEYD